MPRSPAGTTVTPGPSAGAQDGAVLEGVAVAAALAAADAPEPPAELDAPPEEQPVTASSPAAPQASSTEPAAARVGLTFIDMYCSLINVCCYVHLGGCCPFWKVQS